MSKAWPKGVHPTHVAFVMEVHVRRDQHGVSSFRCLQDEEDVRASAALPGSGGLEEAGWALLTEAARAEALMQILLRLTNDVEFKENFEKNDVLNSELIENFTKTTLEQLQRGLSEVLPNVIREALTTVRDGLRTHNG